MPHAIELAHLRKVFRVRERALGVAASLRALVAPREREVVAVDDVSFAIAPGERVAFVGPNGAGKSTTLKILSGILQPSAGHVRVLGLDPGRDRMALAFRIGTVFGQRSQLWSHLPAADTFDLLARIYELEPADYAQRRAELVASFAIAEIVEKPVRQLSLGERMRCELVASLLHRPEILFLDEPTIGLDVVAKATIRDLVRERGRRDGCTVLLTSHDTGDMEGVCERVLVIHRGRLLLDRPIEALRKSFIPKKRVSVVTEEAELRIDLPGVRRLPSAPHRTELEVDLAVIGVDRVVSAIVAGARVLDLSVEDPPMEEIVTAIYGGAEPARGGARMTRARLARSGAKYLAIAGAAVRRGLAERGVLAGRVVFLGAILFIFSRVWETVIGAGPVAIAGAGKRELIWYLAVTEWCVLSVPPIFLSIEAEVRSGDVACRLVRPVSYVGAQLAEAFGETALRLAVLGPASALFALVIAGGWPAEPRGLLLAVPLGLLSSALSVMAMAAIGLSAFWIVDTSPVFWIWQKLVFVLGGLLLPLELYPDWLRAAARLSPFPAMLWGPGRMAFGFAPGAALATFVELVLWSALAALGLALLSRRVRRRLTVNGG